MKIKNFLSSLMTTAMIASAMVSCADISGIEERLDTLESDVKALQGQIAAVHANFETLEVLRGAIVINNVQPVKNGYKITLSNGEVLDLQLVVEQPKEEKPEILGAIEVSEKEVKITLADGAVVLVPVVENFKFAVTLNGAVVTGVQQFAAGAVKEYVVEQSNVASAAIVACPASFKVVLEETKLVVTATGAPATKATASSEHEIAILAVSKQGHSVISKLTVNVGDAEVEPEPTPDPEPENPDTPATSSNDYERYKAGEDIVVAGLTINEATYGPATYITNSSEKKEIGTKGVFFVDSAAEGVTINNAEALIVVGLGDSKPNITKANTIYINKAEQNYVVFSNVTLSIAPSGNNIFAPGGSEEFTISNLVFDKCKINVPADKNLFYSKWPVTSITVVDSDVAMAENTATDRALFNLSATTTVAANINNNIFYCNNGDVTNIKIIGGNNVTLSSLVFKNNTVAKLYPVASNGFISCKAITEGSIVSNLFYIPDYAANVAAYSGIIRMPNGTDETGVSFISNLAFYDVESVSGNQMKASFYRNNGSGELYNKGKNDNPIPSPDYTNGVFTQGEDYKSFGAKR